jgi:hypothetical protein
MLRQITIPIEHEQYFDEVLNEFGLTCDKKPLSSSAIYPDKSSKSYLLYDLKVKRDYGLLRRD